jgi:DNA repair photolyase
VKLEFSEYRPRKIVNTHRHADPWFWTRYSAHPYIGCRSGCEFCYLRGGHYLGRRDPANFDSLIQVKVNAADLLRKELALLEPEVIACGDWQQPAEDRYRLSRAMLEVVRDAGFPLFVVERSPLLTRDIDLLTDIRRRASVTVVFSLSSLDPALKRAFEPRSPGVASRLRAMARLATAGFTVGTALMPVLPMIGDDEAQLDAVVRASAEHGASFILAGGLSMEGVQAEHTYAAARRLNPALESSWRILYGAAPGAPPANALRARHARLGLTVRSLCIRAGLQDRMPRPKLTGPLAINRRVAEWLLNRCYDLELDQAAENRIWAYRKAAWAVEDLPENLADIYAARGASGLRAVPGVGAGLAAEISGWLNRAGASSAD